MKVLNIKFRKTKKVYPFLIDDFKKYGKGDHVIVDTIRGEQIGIVIGTVEKYEIDNTENEEIKIREVKRKLEEEEVEKNYLLNGLKDRSQWSFFVINVVEAR